MSDIPGPAKTEKPKIAHRKKARNLLVQAIYQLQLSNSAIENIEAEFRTDHTGKIDWDFFHQALSYIAENNEALDDGFSVFLDRDVSELTPIELTLLRLGCFEFIERIDVPYKVVINEYVDLAKKYGATDSHKYVNGVLDKAAQKFRQPEVNAKK